MRADRHVAEETRVTGMTQPVRRVRLGRKLMRLLGDGGAVMAVGGVGDTVHCAVRAQLVKVPKV